MLRSFLSTRLRSPKEFSTMRAAVLPAIKGRMKVETLAVPQPQPGEVLVKNVAAGVCHTDLHAMEGHINFPTPAVFGHEISGEIADMNGCDNTGLQIGDRVIGTFVMPCGNCHFCANMQEDICETFFTYNRLKGTLYDGNTRLFRDDKTPIWMYSMAGFAEYSVIPSTAVYKLPDNLPTVESAIVGCSLFTAYGAVRNGGDLRAGANVVVIGCGGVGMNILQMARAFGANKIIGVDIDDDKLHFAKNTMGATHVINAMQVEDVRAKIFEITNSRGADIAFEVLGNPRTFNQATMALRDGGKAVMVGIAPVGTMAQVDITHVVRRKIKIHGSYGAKARQDTPMLLSLLAKGQLTLESISRSYSLEEVADAYDDLKEGKIVGKALVKF